MFLNVGFFPIKSIWSLCVLSYFLTFFRKKKKNCRVLQLKGGGEKIVCIEGKTKLSGRVAPESGYIAFILESGESGGFFSLGILCFRY